MSRNLSTIEVGEPKAVTIADRVFHSLCDAIVIGEIPAGSKISEPELARRFDVSRASLREAIGRLEAASLVTRRPNVGARVVSLSLEELHEIYFVREALEGMAARLAAERMSERQLEALQALLDEDPEFNPLNAVRDFHYAIVHASANPRLIHLLCEDLFHLMRMYRHKYGRDTARAAVASKEHQQILDALRDRDGEMAELLMRRHIRKSRQNVESLVSNPPKEGQHV